MSIVALSAAAVPALTGINPQGGSNPRTDVDYGTESWAELLGFPLCVDPARAAHPGIAFGVGEGICWSCRGLGVGILQCQTEGLSPAEPSGAFATPDRAHPAVEQPQFMGYEAAGVQRWQEKQ